MRTKTYLGPLILIVLGAFFLLSNLGFVPHLGPLFARWWPLILIAAGALLLVRRL
jgi:lipopolysaccharide export LptBFGC system permease protein LptF